MQKQKTPNASDTSQTADTIAGNKLAENLAANTGKALDESSKVRQEPVRRRGCGG